MLTQGGYDAGYLYECAIGREARSGSQIVASEPLQAIPIEDCNDVPVTAIKIRSISQSISEFLEWPK